MQCERESAHEDTIINIQKNDDVIIVGYLSVQGSFHGAPLITIQMEEGVNPKIPCSRCLLKAIESYL